MSDPFDDPPNSGDANRVERVRARTSVTNPRIPQPKSGEGGSAGPPPPADRNTDPFASRPPPSRNRSGLMVVRASEAAAAAPPPPVATSLAPSLLPPRRVPTVPPGPAASPAPPPLVDLDTLMGSGPPPPPVPMALDDLLVPASGPPPPPMVPSVAGRSAPPAPMALDPPVEGSGSRRRPTGLMGLDPPVEPSTPTRRPSGLMSLDPPVEPSTPTTRPTSSLPPPPARVPSTPPTRVASNPALAAMGIDDGPPMQPRAPIPTGLREDGTALSPAEAALPSLFKTPEQVKRRRIKIAATGVASIVLGVVTVMLWVANRPPPPKTGSENFAAADLATVSGQFVAGLPRLHHDEVHPVVARIVASVARGLQQGDAPPPEVILTTDKELVAYATPDGRVVLSKGTLLALTSQAELAALAAHLLAHRTLFHLDDVIDEEAKVLLPDFRVALSSNLPTPGSKRVASVGQWHTFSEAQEMEADGAAIVALKRGSWDATAFRTLWQRLEPAPLTAHHPMSPARLTALEAAEQVRLQGSDLVRGDVGRINAAQYVEQVKELLEPPATVAAAPPPEEEARPATTSEPVETRIKTTVIEPKVPEKQKPPPPEAPAPPTPSSPRDAND